MLSPPAFSFPTKVLLLAEMNRKIKSMKEREIVMITIQGLYNTAVCYTPELEEAARKQIQTVCDQAEFAGCKIRIMPDVHAGKGCTIGTTMTIQDKIVPGMLLAACRLNLPCIFISGGPMLPGKSAVTGGRIGLSEQFEYVGANAVGKMSDQILESCAYTACPTCGSCSGMYTANSMNCLCEAIGIALPGNGTIPAVYSKRLQLAKHAGMAVMDMVKKGITARQIINERSIRNALTCDMALGCSTNTVLHLPAIANEAELDMNVLEEFEALTKTTPQIAKVNPAAKPEMEAFYRAGGIPRVMQHLGGLLDTSVMTVSGKTLAENLAGYVYEYPEDPTIIKTVEEPFSKTGGVAVLHGNLCPRTAVSKPGAIDPSMHRFVGKAKCYNSEEEAEEAIPVSYTHLTLPTT